MICPFDGTHVLRYRLVTACKEIELETRCGGRTVAVLTRRREEGGYHVFLGLYFSYLERFACFLFVCFFERERFVVGECLAAPLFRPKDRLIVRTVRDSTCLW